MLPPTSPEAIGEPLYEVFYGLREQPFSLTTDPRFLYLGQGHRQAFDDLLTGVRRREGILLLTGQSGTGKTTLVRAVVKAVEQQTFSAFVLNPYMADDDVVRVVLRDFGLVTRDDIRTSAFANANMAQLLDTLESFLRGLVPLNSFAILVVDEAQSLAPKVLDQIRVLGSFEVDGQRLLQIILVGQPALLTRLRSESLRALNERISRRASLASLDPWDIEAYIAHRLDVAGGKNAVRFDAEATRVIGDLSQGLPRRINLLCDRALEEGRLSGVNVVGPELIRRAAKAIAGSLPRAEDVTAASPELRPAIPAIEPRVMFGTTPEPPRRSGGVW